MADFLVNPIVDKIYKACSVYLKDQYRWQTGMKEELESLRENYPKVQAVVSASTQAQIRDRDPKLNSWFWKLRDAIDEAEDVLDDFEYEKLEEQLTRNKKQQKIVKFVKKTGKRALMMDPNLKRLEAVVKKLDNVSAEVTTFLHLLENAKQEQQELDLQLRRDRETGCLPKSELIGREEEKYFVMQWLTKPTNEDPSPNLYKNISLLSIVGDGGMGKTTLLQHIYEDLKEEFELKMWVCVSNHFDAKKVIADILDFLNMERPHLESPLAAVQERLKAVVQSKRFLLVLDDIWEEDMSKWENVLSPLTNGIFGSKILLTTRMDAVSSAIVKVIKKKVESFRIEGLKEDVCLQLLKTHAFAGVENLGAHAKLKDIASSIVKKLSGYPLAAKVIGGVLNSNLQESFWRNILNRTVVLDIESEPGRKDILPILKLSFTSLPQRLQNCFAFCGIFQKDYRFDKDDLVRMWIALSFIQESSFEGETLEDIGGRYFDVLVRKCFFDEFQNDNKIYYKTHDLLHDLAQSTSSEECFKFVGENVSSFKIPKNVRHLRIATKNLEVLRTIKDAKNLHSLFLITLTDDQRFTEILTKVFKASRSIRLLFIHSPLQKKMSEAIKNLRHLRYLKLSADLTQMPRSLSSLYHLQFIIFKKMESCSDDFLPGDVSNLSNLRHLKFPPNVLSSVRGIGNLRSLQELNEFNVKNENGYRIGELEHMNELHKLKVNFLENVKDAGEACNAKLFEKGKLTDLFLNWGNTVDERVSETGHESLRNFADSDLDMDVLENLKPHKNLKRLSIASQKGVSSAKWMYKEDLISNLEYISLNGCSEWETLPPFGQLPHLKSLYLCNMPKVKQFDGAGAGAGADNCFFPCLTELFLVNCPNLQELSYLPPKLKKMKIQNIGWKAALNCKQETNNCCLEKLEVLSCPNITSLVSVGGLQQIESGIEKFQLIVSEVVIDDLSLLPTVSIASLEKLTICNNDVLVSFPIEAEQWFLHVSSSLRELSFKGLKSLQSLPSSLERLSSLWFLGVVKIPQLQQLLHIPASLSELRLEYLESLQCLPTSLSTIHQLVLSNIPLLKSLPNLPSSLYSLTIESLDNLECLPSSLSAISSLKNLKLKSIPLLKSLSDLPSSLYSLTIESLDNLECLPSSLSAISSLNRLFLVRIPLLKSLPDLPSSLNTLLILNCHPTLMKRYKTLSGSDWHKIAHIPNVASHQNMNV